MCTVTIPPQFDQDFSTLRLCLRRPLNLRQTKMVGHPNICWMCSTEHHAAGKKQQVSIARVMELTSHGQYNKMIYITRFHLSKHKLYALKTIKILQEHTGPKDTR